MSSPTSIPDARFPFATGTRGVRVLSLSVLVALGAWLAVLCAALATRSPLPIDETRYLDVAWEMWRDGAWLVPRLNGEPYADKPPLMFWSILLAWRAFGVHELVARCVPPLYALGALALVADLGRALWPHAPGGGHRPGGLACVILAGTFYWTVFSSVVMFDVMLAFFVLAAVRAVVAARDGGGAVAWLLAGIALGGGVLAKGPVVVVHVLPVVLLAPLWNAVPPSGGWRRWYAGATLSIVMAAAIGLAWALPAAYAGGAAYRADLLLDQTAGRVVGSFAHDRPWWFYLPLSPLLLAPWLAWPGLWRRRADGEGSDAGTRLCLVWFFGGLAILSLVSGKQPHYLIPLFPAFALFVAHRLTCAPAPGRGARAPTALFTGLIGALLLVVAFAGESIEALGSARAAAADVSPLWGLLTLMAATGFVLLPAASVRTAPRLASGATLLVALAIVCLSFALAPVLRAKFDAEPLARRLGALQREGVPLAHVGEYHGQFGLPGRLEVPIDVIDCANASIWARAHPDGQVVVPVDSDIYPWRLGDRALVPASSMPSVCRR